MSMHYQNDLEYLLDQLAKIDLRIAILLRSRDGSGGLGMTLEEMQSLLKYRGEQPSSTRDREALRGLEMEVDRKVKNGLKMGIRLNVPEICKLFGLNEVERDALMICAAPDLDVKYERLYGFIQDDLTKTRPSLGLVISLLSSTNEEAFRIRHHFLPKGPLFREGLIEPADGSEDIALSTMLKTPSEVLPFLIGIERAGLANRSALDLEAAKSRLAALSMDEAARAQAYNLMIRSLTDGSWSWISILKGPYGAGKGEIVDLICKALGQKIIKVRLSALGEDAAALTRGLRRMFRQAILEGGIPYIEGMEELPEESGGRALREAVFRFIDASAKRAFLVVQRDVEIPRGLEKEVVPIEIPVLSYGARKEIWRAQLKWRASEEELSDLAAKFRLTPGQIDEAVTSAKAKAKMLGMNHPGIDEIHTGCLAQSGRGLAALAQKVNAVYGWDDLVLPKAKLDQLKEVLAQIKHQGEVYQEWGFGGKLSSGRGINVLFTGPSGTGKTMAAGVIARELKLDLYKVDLSQVVSKYIGETEKNLGKIFQAAEDSSSILFFDEADALFGKRSEVKDAHDRYANVEISYLLQKMEEHEGVVILATNLGCNMDQAFVRRMTAIVEFPFPDEEARHSIWEGQIPTEAPVGDDLDLQYLSRRFKIAGGNIKNIVLNAAFLAAEDGGRINQRHMVKATWRELQKMGKVFTRNDFGKYYDLIDEMRSARSDEID